LLNYVGKAVPIHIMESHQGNGGITTLVPNLVTR